MLNLSLFFTAVFFLSACSARPVPPTPDEIEINETVSQTTTESTTPSDSPATTTEVKGDKLEITELTVGTGAVAEPGNQVTVHYTGTLADGSVFDSSVGKQPFTFNLGARDVIAGWEEGVPGMKVGGKRKLVIPPELAYGASGAGGVIPPNATLTFEIELLGVK